MRVERLDELSPYLFWQRMRDAWEVKPPELTPEKELLVAMLFRAAQDLHLVDAEIRAEAIDWLSCREWASSDEGWSFIAVCQFLGLNANKTRDMIYKRPRTQWGKGVAVRRVDPRDRRK